MASGVTLGLGSLPPERLKYASGLFNMMRDLGGAVGIAIVGAILNNRTNLHFTDIASRLTAANQPMNKMLGTLEAQLGPALGSAQAGAAASLLGGCTVGPDYRPADSPLAPNHASQDALRTLQARPAAEPVALDAWWLGFHDPVLTQLIERALAQNLDLAAAEARVAQARAAAADAGAQRLPRLDVEGTAARQRQSLESPLGRIGSALPGYDRNQGYTQLGLGASWELDLAGGLRRQARAEAAEALHAGSRVSVAADAADDYFRLRGLQARIAIVEQQIEADRQLVSLVRDRVGNGVATRREQAEAEARLAQTRSQRPPLLAERARQANRLNILMGSAPGTYTAQLGAPVADPVVPGLPAAIGPDTLLRHRPDVVAAERRLAASNAGIGAALAEYYPKLSLSGILGFEALDGPLFKSAAFQPGALAGLRWRLFDFGRVDAEVAQARGRHAEALAVYRQAVLRAAEDVENAVTDWAQIGAQRDELARQVQAEALAQRAARDAYAQGDASLVEVRLEDQQWLSASGRAGAPERRLRARGGGHLPLAGRRLDAAGNRPGGTRRQLAPGSPGPMKKHAQPVKTAMVAIFPCHRIRATCSAFPHPTRRASHEPGSAEIAVSLRHLATGRARGHGDVRRPARAARNPHHAVHHPDGPVWRRGSLDARPVGRPAARPDHPQPHPGRAALAQAGALAVRSRRQARASVVPHAHRRKALRNLPARLGSGPARAGAPRRQGRPAGIQQRGLSIDGGTGRLSGARAPDRAAGPSPGRR